MQTEDESLKPNRAWKIALVGVPLFLLISSAGAMWLWWTKSRETAPDPRLALAASEVQEQELEDHLHKLNDMIGARDWDTPEGRRAMRRAIAFLEGTLSPQNYGFAVERGAHLTRHDELWPTFWVDLAGTEQGREVVMVAAPYDLRVGSPAAVLGAVNDLRDEKMRKTVRFAFFPAQLYAQEGGMSPTSLLQEGEALVELVTPELPGIERQLTAAEVVPIAQGLVEVVRRLAR